ncbi:hypothetical protein BHE74_00014842, partial [Ensete ventricosum]
MNRNKVCARFQTEANGTEPNRDGSPRKRIKGTSPAAEKEGKSGRGFHENKHERRPRRRCGGITRFSSTSSGRKEGTPFPLPMAAPFSPRLPNPTALLLSLASSPVRGDRKPTLSPPASPPVISSPGHRRQRREPISAPRLRSASRVSSLTGSARSSSLSSGGPGLIPNDSSLRMDSLSGNYIRFFGRNFGLKWMPLASGDGVVFGLIGANVAVFLLWRIADPAFMRKHFMGASAAVNAIILLNVFLFPKNIYYINFIIPVPAALM